jgi:HprK-related kinase B
VTPVSASLHVDTPFELVLRVVDVDLRVLTNDADVLAALGAYYAPYLARPGARPASVVRLVQGRPPAAGVFTDLVRAGGKRVKEAVRDEGDGRLILKRATGVLMGLRPGEAFALGDVRGNVNQAVNLINACYAKTVLTRGYVLLHASAVSWGGRAAILAGVPGAGKSTASLHLVEAGFRFVSNDRVLAAAGSAGVDVLGYPKQPRVNPGTLLHHPRLVTLLEPEEREALAALPRETLWALERKRDVDLDAIYGVGTVELRGTMSALVLLRWRLGGDAFGAREIAVEEALDQLPVFRKDLGAFDLDRPPETPPDGERARYAAVLERTRIVEVTGRPDFMALVGLVRDLLSGVPA